MDSFQQSFRKGVKSGLVIALGYIPIAIAFGLLAKSSGVPWWTACFMSFAVFAGASQFVGAGMLAAGAAGWEIVMTTFVLNVRHFLMSTSLSQRLEKSISRKMLSFISFGVTDETFSVASLRQDLPLKAGFVLGLNLVAYAAWNGGTWLGLAAGSLLPEAVQSSMGISLYAMFIGLLIPALTSSKPAVVVTLISVAAAAALHWLPAFAALSGGWKVMLSALVAAAAGAYYFPEKEREQHERT
ncbi:AzlC family ABC transporter permease [Paenibacillus turpanensis]|uniref:AzlC family ABC transporter permease n=1 Tax=Paenibacillus turpanensis TaxID=2689078 RepID=UPI001A9E8B7F|nr:AzlC family ABC transporter permease [Paenibacillus turpanensis]